MELNRVNKMDMYQPSIKFNILRPSKPKFDYTLPNEMYLHHPYHGGAYK